MDSHSIKIAIIEDEMIVAAKISMYLKALGYEVTGIIPQSEDVLNHIEATKPDIVLLDIQLRGTLDGIELASKLNVAYEIPIVYLTANAGDATFERARETKPDAFLTKPFKKVDLKRTLELVVSRMKNKSESETEVENEGNFPPLSDRIFVLHNDKKVKIILDSILYIEAERSYCRIVTTDASYVLTMPMKSLENVLPTSSFQRIHRSYIVNLKRVDEVDETTVVVGGKLLGVSRSHRREFLRMIRSV